MKVTFLGTSAAWASARHNNVCFVAHSREPILFDCGPSIVHQLAVAGIEPEEIRTVIVSHIHGDHSLGLPMFLVVAQISGRRRPLTVCMPQSAIGPMKKVCATVFPNLPKYAESASVEWVPLPETGSGTFGLAGQAEATTARAQHPVPVVSTHVRFGAERVSLAYSGDTAYCERVAHNAQGADLLVHESNWSVALKTATGHGHSTATDAANVARLAGARRLALVHTLRDLAGHEPEIEAEAAEVFGGEVFAPTDFSTFEV